MDAFISVTVPHGLTLANIRWITATVRNDAATAHYPMAAEPSGGTPAATQWWVAGADSSNVTLVRKGSGVFDGTDFDSTSYNRGWVVLHYV